MLLGKMIGYFTVAAMIILLLAYIKFRAGEQKTSIILFIVGMVMLFNDHFLTIVALLLIVFGVFYLNSNRVESAGKMIRRQHLLESLRWNKQPWELRSMSIWSFIGEIHLDLTIAILDEKEVTIVLQGVVGDIDIIIPEDMGVDIHSNIFIGQTMIGAEKEEGLLNKLEWTSKNYEDSEYKVKLVVSYLVGDVNIKIL